GAIDSDMLRELHAWRVPVPVPEEEPFGTVEEALAYLEAALEGEPQVALRYTDLDLLREYNRTRQKIKLHLEVGEESSTITAIAGKTAAGEYIIPNNSATFQDLMLDERSYIIDGDQRVQVREVKDF